MANAATSWTPREGVHPSRVGSRLLARSLRVLAIGLLTASALAVLAFVRQFALTRFFTIDEYQWGHATWLLSKGQVPYRDFYEHHLPLGYLLHSLFLAPEGSFIERALLLRKLAFSYIFVASCLVAGSSYVARRDVLQALLCVIVPISIGFGLMSAVDYRGDNWSAFTLLCSFSLLEINQLAQRRWLAALAGLLLSIAVLMTQKALLLGGAAVLVMLVVSFWRQLAKHPPRWLARFDAQTIPHAAVFCLAAALPVALLAAAGAHYGVLARAWEINVTQALLHEKLYPAFSAWRYITPFLYHCPWANALLAGFALIYCARGLRSFWALPTASVLLGGLKITAPYPYNFVLASYLIGLCAVRGYCRLLRWSAARWPRLAAPAPLLYLLPLALLPTQLGFVQGRTTNTEQLETLRQIELHSKPEDVVIDSEGGALFRPHRGYYWYQGAAHIQMFDAYFRGPFLADLRTSRAPFWLTGYRTQQLPEAAQQYLLQHYVRFRGDLSVLGFVFPGNELDHPVDTPFEVVRAAEYYLFPAPAPDGQLSIDGKPVTEAALYLDAGWHRASLASGAAGYRLSYLPPSAFGTSAHVGRHAPLFEYDRPR